MAGMLEYKCPCCDGAIQFDSATQKMKCPYCDTEFDVDTLKGYDEELKDEKPSEMEWATPGGSWAEGETAGLHTYSCKSCGGEIVGDDTMAASACPFCGNPIVLTGQFAGTLRPDLIIPFKLDKKAAKAKLQEHLKGKTLLPRVFRSQNHIDEIKGVYVPFWLFDSDADAQLRFTATRTRCWSDSKYDYTETNYYSVRRDGTLGFDAVPVDGSSKIEDDLMESIEPFAMQDAIPFQTAYLAGYVADKYDVSAEDSIERANKRIRRSTEETFQQTVTGYDSVKVDRPRPDARLRPAAQRLRRGFYCGGRYPQMGFWLLHHQHDWLSGAGHSRHAGRVHAGLSGKILPQDLPGGHFHDRCALLLAGAVRHHRPHCPWPHRLEDRHLHF